VAGVAEGGGVEVGRPGVGEATGVAVSAAPQAAAARLRNRMQMRAVFMRAGGRGST